MTFRKYIGDSKMFEYDNHFRSCQSLNKPFIKAKINPKTNDYFVQIDLMPCTYELTGKEQEEIKNLAKNTMSLIPSSTGPEFDNFSINKELAWFDGIPADNLDNFCNNLFDLVCERHL